MGFLLRRSPARARAGWYDNFNRPDENPLGFPWSSWGEPRTVFLASNRLVLGYDSGGWFQPNPDGGVAYEHQPLTPDWAVEFFCQIEIPTRDNGDVNVFLDRNWTAGGSASSTEYQTYFGLRKETTEDDEGDETVTRRAHIRCRRKGAWLLALSYSFTMTQAQWAATNHWKIVVFQDKYVGIVMNGKLVALRILENSNYYLGPGKRAANFRNNHQSEVYIDDFRTYDRPALTATAWVSEFFDDFNRTTGTTVGNGWSQLGSNFGINANALSMQGGFPSDGRRGVWRDGISSGNMRILFTLGGGTGDPNAIAETTVLGRVNSAGTLGIGVWINAASVRIVKMTGAVNAPTYLDLTEPISVVGGDIANGQQYALCFHDDEAWIERVSDGAPLVWSDGIDAHSPESNRGVAVVLRRQSFANSAPVNDLRVLTAI